jgi:isoquinoline 1-oxidoreductase beta subunit
MFGKRTFKEGKPEQNNFAAYRLTRMKEIPEIEVHFVDNGIDPTGLGEPALLPIGIYSDKNYIQNRYSKY